MFVIAEFRVVFPLVHGMSLVGSFCCKMHVYGATCLCIVSGLLNVVCTEKSLLNICTADLHQDIHVIQDIQQRYVDVS